MEWNLNNETVAKEYIFEGDIPDDTFHATGPNQSFTYRIKNGDGEYINGIVYHAYSVLYEREFLWKYYWISDNELFGKKYANTNYQEIPGFMENRVDISITDIKKKPIDYEMYFEYKLSYVRSLLTFLNSNRPEDGVKQVAIPFNERYTIEVNGEKIFEDEHFIFSSESHDLTGNFQLDSRDFEDKVDVVIKTKNLRKGPDEQIIDYQVIKKFAINNKTNDLIDIDFNEGLNETIYSPIEYNFEEDLYVYEEIKLEKMFDDRYIYPEVTKELIKLDYTDNTTTLQPSFSWTIDNKINIDNVNADTFDTVVTSESDSYLISFNNETYYNEKTGLVEFGKGHDGMLTSNGLTLPWDTKSNGEIDFSINFETYHAYRINFKLNIGSNHTLRGKDGRYEFIEVNNEE